MAANSNLPKVSVVVLNYNTAPLLEKLLPFVLATDYENLEVVVADNASKDNSLAVVKEKFPGIKVIEIQKNLGFAGGYNEALKQINSEFYVLLNSDVEVTENWLLPMIKLMMQHTQIAAVQPKILDYHQRDKFEYAGAAGGYIDFLGYPFCRGRIFDHLEKDNRQYEDETQVFWATGAAMLVRAEDYHLVGGLDDAFFAHMEEIDLCWRLQQVDKEVWVCPASVVYHMGGGTLSSQSTHKTFLNYRNNLALLFKNLPKRALFFVLFIRMVLDGISGIKYIFNSKADHCFAIVRAHLAFYAKLPYWVEQRRKIGPKKRPSHLRGMHKLSVVWAYFVRGKRTFKEL